MKSIKILGFFLALCGVTLSTTAHADIICRGKPTWVVVDRGGFVAAEFGFGGIYFCNLEADVTAPYGALKSSRPAMVSQLMTAAAAGKDVGLYFVGLSSCTGIRASTGWAIQQPAQMYFYLDRPQVPRAVQFLSQIEE